MKVVEVAGKSVDEAIEKALDQLGTTIEKVDVEILEAPSNGFLGLIGTKDAKIKVTLDEDPKEIALEFLNDMFEKMDIEVDIQIEQTDKSLDIEFFGKEMALLIGKRGVTLNAIQYLTSLIVNKEREDYIRVIVDTKNYREKRKKTLISLANKLGKKVERRKKKVVLEPMNPYERRIIHSALQNNPKVLTRSKGQEPNRRVEIFLKK